MASQYEAPFCFSFKIANFFVAFNRESHHRTLEYGSEISLPRRLKFR